VEHSFDVFTVVVLREENVLASHGVFAQKLVPVLMDALMRSKEVGGAVILSAVTVFRYLARNRASTVNIAREKVVGTLTQLLTVGGRKKQHGGSSCDQQEEALQAAVIGFLANMAEHEEGRQEIMRCKVVGRLVGVCGANAVGSVTGQEAATTLARIAFDCDDGKDQIVSDGAVVYISKLCFRLPETITLQVVVQALTNLTSIDKVRVLIMGQGLVVAMLHVCEVANDPLVLRVAATALRNLSLNKQCREGMVRAGTTASLVMVCMQMLRKPASRDTTTVLQYAMQTICNLSYAIECRAKLIADGIIRPLALVCERMGSQAEMLVAELLRNLSSDQECLKQLVDKGASVAITRLCKSTNPTVLDNAAGALANLSALEINRSELVGQGMVPALVALGSKEGISAGILTSTAAALRNFARTDGVRGAMVGQGAVEMLVQLCAHDHQAVKGYAAGALVNLSLQPKNAKALVAKGTIPPLVHLCRASHGGGAMVKFASQALCILAQYSAADGHTQFGKGDAVEVLVQLLGLSKDVVVLENATGVLTSIALSSQCALTLMRHGAIKPLLLFCQSQSQQQRVVRNSIATIRNMSAHHLVALELRAAGVVPILVDMVNKVQDPTMSAHGTGALANMCKVETATTKLMQGGVVWCGGVSAMVRLCATSKVKPVLIQATKGLESLAANGFARQLMQYHAIAALVRLGGEEQDPVILKTVSLAIRSLSKDVKCRAQLVAVGVIVVLIRMCTRTADLSLLELASGTLINIGSDNSTTIGPGHADAVTPLVHLCKTAAHGSVLSFVAAALGTLSAHEECRCSAHHAALNLYCPLTCANAGRISLSRVGSVPS
jgi:hypothetical protein